MRTAILIFLSLIGALFLAIFGAYWWSNVPPRRPSDVSANAVFLWAGHVGLPAAKHGTWIECWTDVPERVNKCRLTEMDGRLEFEGIFLADSSKNPVSSSDLQILSEETSQSVNLWVRVEGQLIPLVFLKDGTVLIPKDAFQEGMANLEHLRQDRGR